jgi:hypothetical protein
MPPTSSNEEWADGRNPTLERDFDALTNVVASSAIGCDEVEVEIKWQHPSMMHGKHVAYPWISPIDPMEI